jgi:hypothetical protein
MIRYPDGPGEHGSGTAQQAPPPADPGTPLAVSHAEMNAAHEDGTAVLLAESVSWLARYQDAWWVVYEHGWLRITDDLASADLDQVSARLRAAEETAGGDRS